MSDQAKDPPLYYRKHVFVCLNVRDEAHPRGCCSAKGGEDMRNYMKAKAKAMGLKDVRINIAGCLERCEVGPNMVIYPEGVWYRCTEFADIDEVLQKHLVEDQRVERLMVLPEEGPDWPLAPEKQADPAE